MIIVSSSSCYRCSCRCRRSRSNVTVRMLMIVVKIGMMMRSRIISHSTSSTSICNSTSSSTSGSITSIVISGVTCIGMTLSIDCIVVVVDITAGEELCFPLFPQRDQRSRCLMYQRYHIQLKSNRKWRDRTTP